MLALEYCTKFSQWHLLKNDVSESGFFLALHDHSSFRLNIAYCTLGDFNQSICHRLVNTNGYEVNRELCLPGQFGERACKRLLRRFESYGFWHMPSIISSDNVSLDGQSIVSLVKKPGSEAKAVLIYDVKNSRLVYPGLTDMIINLCRFRTVQLRIHRLLGRIKDVKG